MQRAKRLIDEPSLPMTEIAMQAGFSAVYAGSTPSLPKSTATSCSMKFGAHGDRPLRRWKRSRECR